MSDKKVTNFEPLFESTYQQVIDHLFTDQKHCGQLVEVKCWLQKAIEYNLKNGKRNRAKSLLLAYELLASDHVAEDKLRQACILGWCVELLQSYFLILDDIMDNSITRRGQLCWYRKVCFGKNPVSRISKICHNLGERRLHSNQRCSDAQQSDFLTAGGKLFLLLSLHWVCQSLQRGEASWLFSFSF